MRKGGITTASQSTTLFLVPLFSLVSDHVRQRLLQQRCSSAAVCPALASLISEPDLMACAVRLLLANRPCVGLTSDRRVNCVVHSLFGSLPFIGEVHASHLSDEGLHPTAYPWPHNGLLDTFDHASIRRGYQVYREVCAACHSLDRIAWRNLVGVSHTADEARVMAEEVEYEDGPNDQGEMFQRPGKLLITCRDYVFSLLTGYIDPPAGVEIREGMNYNPYFPGGAIPWLGSCLMVWLNTMMVSVVHGTVMASGVNIDCPCIGTPATTSQMAKDVVTFLNWAAEPEHDERKKYGIKAVILFSTLWAISIYVKRYKWAPLKNRKIRKFLRLPRHIHFSSNPQYTTHPETNCTR
ncbi:cytochrome c1, component of the mitochondrial respiratory chain [Salix suchowensis]|nr:cytochrome c1, component of the mitochondrial respiratory chain [Salix suchowensis]